MPRPGPGPLKRRGPWAAAKASGGAAHAGESSAAPAAAAGERKRPGKKTKREQEVAGEERGYSVNALSKLTGADRRTIDKALVGIAPLRAEGKTKFYRLADVQEALKKKPSGLKEEKLAEEIRKLRMANDEKEGLLIPKADVANAVTKLRGEVRTLLFQKLMNEYPASVAGMDVGQAREYGGRLFDSIMLKVQGWADVWLKRS